LTVVVNRIAESEVKYPTPKPDSDFLKFRTPIPDPEFPIFPTLTPDSDLPKISDSDSLT